eukprot:scaffold32130_cov73-Isochrysis_galbana.AAC.1
MASWSQGHKNRPASRSRLKSTDGGHGPHPLSAPSTSPCAQPSSLPVSPAGGGTSTTPAAEIRISNCRLAVWSSSAQLAGPAGTISHWAYGSSRCLGTTSATVHVSRGM